MNKIKFMGYAFTNEDIVGFPTAYTHQALISAELNADEIQVRLRYNPNYLGYYIDDAVEGSDFLRVQGNVYAVKSGGGSFPFTEYDNATPIDLYKDDTLLARYYITSIAPKYEKDGYIYFDVSAVSFIGLTIKMAHNGGLYVSTPIGDIIADILKATKDNARSTSSLFFFNMQNGLYYTIDPLVFNYRVSGRLPATDGETITARENLRDVLFASGASILKNADGSLYFTFNQPSEAIPIEDEKIYLGQPYKEDSIVTTVKVISHAYFAIEGGEEKTLFDSSGDVVDHAKVLFNEPIFRFSDTTLTINESGVNYAIVSGTGVLKGFEYTHTRQEFSKQIAQGIENIKTSTNSLVSTLNYLSVLERMENYFKNAREMQTAFVLPANVKAGSLVRFTDMFNNAKNGFIKDVDITYSGIDKGVANVVVDWTPSNVGEGFTKCYVLQGAGTWNKASAEAEIGHAITKARIVLLGGGHGGYKGADGEAGSTSKGGAGGDGGAGGEAGKVFAVTLDGNIPASIPYNCGTGGAPAQDGNPTTATVGGTVYTSANGSIPAGGVMNLITGEVYATAGESGYRGGHGGEAGIDFGSGTNYGEPITYKGQTWQGGEPFIVPAWDYEGDTRGWFWRYPVVNYQGQSVVDTTGRYGSKESVSYGGTAGGGSAVGSNGKKTAKVGGYSGIYKSGNYVIGVATIIGTDGANGADAIDAEGTPNIASGGFGGHGGGGGSQRAEAKSAGGWSRLDTSATIQGNNVQGAEGRGGYGSNGTSGGNGAFLIYV